MMNPQHDAHVKTWVKHHARQLSRKAITEGYKPQALHEYTDQHGAVTHWRIRLKHPDTGEKWIRPLRRDTSGGWELKAPEFENGAPLYNLHQLCDPERQTERVILVEGEYKVDMLALRGIIATTSGGAQSVEATGWQPLAGRNVLVWADNDKPGFEYAQHAAAKLKALGCEVAFIDVAALNLPPKGDCVDWLKTFHQQHERKATAADIWALPVIEGAPGAVEAIGSDLSDSNKGGDTKVLPQDFAPLPVVRITCAADIKPEPIRWLWDGWLARGKFHIFAGQAGTGKTTIAIALAATVSIGGRFPDGTRAPVGNVLIWSGEDSAQDTLVPRLLAAGANMERVHFIGDVQHGDEIHSFDPATDIPAMFYAATRIGDISLLIVDPVVNAVAGDSHKNGEVRRALQPLVDFGEKLGCAVLGISHFSKGTGGKDPMERVTGSLAFAALARIVLATAKINDGGTTKHIFCRAKSNIGVDHGGFEYDLHQKEIDGHKGLFASYSAWGQAVEGTARELLAESKSDNDDGEGASAEQFLRDALAGGAMSQKEIEADCRGAGFSLSTMKRAKKRIGIVSKKDGMKGVWFWSLPGEKCEEVHEGDEEAQQICVNPFGENEPLREDSTATVAPNASHLRI